MVKKTIPIHQMDEHLDGVAIYRTSEQTLLQPIKEEVLLPHRHDHYTCFLITNGSGTFTLDFQEITIHKASLMVSYPGQVHQLGSIENLKVGSWLLTLNWWMKMHGPSLSNQLLMWLCCI